MRGIRTASGSSHWVALFTGATPSSSNGLTSSRNSGYSRKAITLETYQADSGEDDTGIRKATTPAVSWSASADWQDSALSLAIMSSSSGSYDNSGSNSNVIFYDDITRASLANGGQLTLTGLTYSLS